MTTTLIDLPCQTKEHARNRVYYSRLGSLAGATIPYLEELQVQLHRWVEEVNQEMAKRVIQSIIQEENETESYRTQVGD